MLEDVFIGADCPGGLIGWSNGTPTCSNSYFDTTTTGQEDNELGKPKTTEEMKTQSTYSGWDFTNTWQISAGEYPTLK